MKTFRAELHVHTVLSPCALVEMIPPLIVREALARGINLIAITDHNHTANIAAVQKASEGAGLHVLPGMELQTREEVHVLCLFDTLAQALALQEYVDQRLPAIDNNPDYFGEQFVVNESGDFIRREERLLLNSVDASFEQVFETVGSLGGLFIPAHVNRKGFGLIANLGLVPPELPLAALEISRQLKIQDAVKQFPQLRGYPLIQSGDVHALEDFLGANHLQMEAASIAELRLALLQESGRALRVSP